MTENKIEFKVLKNVANVNLGVSYPNDPTIRFIS